MMGLDTGHEVDHEPVLGDMSPDEFRREAYRLADWIAQHVSTVETRPVLAQVEPGAITRSLPETAPEQGESFEAMLSDVERLLVPGLTQWNHPSFFAYFPVGASGAGTLGEFLCAALSQQAMLWRTSPAATELEHVVLGWLRRAIGLDDRFEGVIYDTASTATLHALAAAREARVPHVRQLGLAGRPDIRGVAVYCSEHAHSSVDKAVMTLGLGHRSLRRIGADAAFSMRADLLAAAIESDLAEGYLPLAVVATVGSTSSTSVDPVPAIAAICERHGLWLHVDAAYAGSAALLPEMAWMTAGFARAHSFVMNPHKWLFTPFDVSTFYCREMDTMRAAFSLTPEYLRTSEPVHVRNLMDTGFQLGRRFRALKLWFVLRWFGLEGVRARLREHMRLARLFADWVDADASFVRVGAVPFSVVCFRAVDGPAAVRGNSAAVDMAGPAAGACPADDELPSGERARLDSLNEALMHAVNATGEVFLSHTRLDGRIVLRVAIGSLRTTEASLARAWALIRACRLRLTTRGSEP